MKTIALALVALCCALSSARAVLYQFEWTFDTGEIVRGTFSASGVDGDGFLIFTDRSVIEWTADLMDGAGPQIQGDGPWSHYLTIDALDPEFGDLGFYPPAIPANGSFAGLELLLVSDGNPIWDESPEAHFMVDSWGGYYNIEGEKSWEERFDEDGEFLGDFLSIEPLTGPGTWQLTRLSVPDSGSTLPLAALALLSLTALRARSRRES